MGKKMIVDKDSITPIADKFREIIGIPSETKFPLSEFPSMVQTASDHSYWEGQQEAYDEFWDGFQSNGARTNYLYAFAGFGWRDEIYNPKYPIVASQNASGMFYYSYLTDTKVLVDLSNAVRNVTNMFAESKLVTIRIKFGENNPKFTDAFQNCSALENLIAEGVIPKSISLKWSTKLSKDSITNVIAILSGTSTEQTLTLSLTAVNKAFETSTGANDGSTSAEWASLIATKQNWTMSLV